MYHTYNPMVQNACTQDAFLQIRRYIHFLDNARLLPKTDPRWHPLQKIQIAIDIILKTLASGWILGKQICVDESMIKYMGRFVSFIQYMPAKPIKHGIKVYALCCAYTGYLYMFEIYTGKGSTPDGSPTGVVSRLLHGAGATGTSGRILYTDNFYTSLKVMNHIFTSFGMLLVGTYALTKKKSRSADDFPFAKLSIEEGKAWMDANCSSQNHQKESDNSHVHSPSHSMERQKTCWLSSQPSRRGHVGPHCTTMVTTEEKEEVDSESRGDYRLLIPHERSRS